jgi:hypothetical protein
VRGIQRVAILRAGIEVLAFKAMRGAMQVVVGDRSGLDETAWINSSMSP